MKQILHVGPGIVFGIPTLGRPVPLDWALSLKSLNPPINFNTVFQIVRGREVGDARNAIANYALQSEAKYLFFLGDDVVVPNHTLKQLIFRMEQDTTIGVVGGVYCSKSTPSAPLVFRGNGGGSYWDWKIGEFFECTGLGMDCTLIRASIFKEISQPWFKTHEDDKFLDGKNEAESWTEDLWFLEKVKKETNYRIFCDASVICEHWDVYKGIKYGLPVNSLPMRQKGVIKNKKCLIIGAPLNLADESYDITRFSDDDAADYRGQVNNLPFETEEFNFIIIRSISSHSVICSFAEWLRVLKPSGKLAIEFDEFTNKSAMIEWIKNKGFDPKEDGSFIEFIKPPIKKTKKK